MISIRVIPAEALHIDDVMREIGNDSRFGVDVALYGRERFDSRVVAALCGLDERQKSMHLDHYSYAAEDIIAGMSFDAQHAFARDVSFAGKTNIWNAVLHWTRDGRQCPLPSVKQMTMVLSAFEERDIVPVIENLIVGFEWQRKLIEIAIQSGLPFGVCFDIGHAKIYGGKPLDAWLLWLDDLYAHGVPLIFHLHGNRGVNDDHLPLWMDEQICEVSCVTNDCFAPGGIVQAVRSFFPERFPGATFVLETQARFAVENIRWARQYLMDDQT